MLPTLNWAERDDGGGVNKRRADRFVCAAQTVRLEKPAVASVEPRRVHWGDPPGPWSDRSRRTGVEACGFQPVLIF